MKDWDKAAEKLDAAHRAQLGLADDAILSRWQRFGRPGLFITPGAEVENPLEYLQRRYASGDRTDDLFAKMAVAK